MPILDLRQANKSIEYAQDTYQRGLVFKSGVLDWETPGGLVQVVVTDASHANEEEEMLVNGMVSIEGHRSQGARMVFLASPDIWNGNKGFVPGPPTSSDECAEAPHRQKLTRFSLVWRTEMSSAPR